MHVDAEHRRRKAGGWWRESGKGISKREFAFQGVLCTSEGGKQVYKGWGAAMAKCGGPTQNAAGSDIKGETKNSRNALSNGEGRSNSEKHTEAGAGQKALRELG